MPVTRLSALPLLLAIVGDTAGLDAAVGVAVGAAGLVTRDASLSEFLARQTRARAERPQQPPAPAADVLREPDLILVCQQWPDEHTAAEIEQLIGSFPLARIVCCYGPWCASDGRTRTLWPPALRSPADEATLRIRQELRVLAGDLSPLPATASLDELFAFLNA